MKRLHHIIIPGLLRRGAAPLASLLLWGLVSAGCGAGPEPGAPPAPESASGSQGASSSLEDTPKTPEEAGQEVLAEYEGRCEGPLTGRVSAPDNDLGVRAYAYAIDREDERIRVVLEGEGGARLGTWSARQLQDELGEPIPGGVEMRVRGDGEASPIVTRTSFRAIGADTIQYEATTSRGEESFRTQLDFDGLGQLTGGRLLRTVSAERAEQVELGARLSRVGGEVAYALELLDGQGQPVEESVLEEWLEQVQMPEWFTSRELELLTVMGEDATWAEETVEHARGCERAAAIARGMQTRAQPLGANESCSWTDLFSPDGGGGVNIIINSVALGIGVALAGGFALTVGTAAAVVAVVLAVAATGYWIYKKTCTSAGCHSACVSEGAGATGSCDGTFSCSCSGEPEAGAGGDPHLITHDGLYYDLQASGEFIALEATGGEPLTLQVRQEPSESAGRCPGVTYQTVLATEVRGISVQAFARVEGPMMRVSGEVVELEPGQLLELERGGALERLGDGSAYVLTWPGGERLEIDRAGSHLDLWIDLPPSRRGQVRGLWGNYDLDDSNDLTTRDGRVYGQGLDFEDLYADFAASWQVGRGESLFDYSITGDDWETYATLTYPRSGRLLDAIDPQIVDQARQTCEMAGVDPVLLEGCTLDVVCDPRGAEATGFFTDAPGPLTGLDVTQPIFFDDWTQEGDSSNGDWVISDDGRAVIQENNGEPTFFVSPNEYFETTFRGTIEVQTTGDDDIVGVVFGYQSPLMSQGDETNDVRAFVLSWKQAEQSFAGYVSPEGFTLGYVSGAVPEDQTGQVFWGFEDTMTHTPIATYHGPNTGWKDNTEHDFALSYGAQGIRVTMDGQEIFDLDAAEVSVPLQPGRFGFYNYSQSDVRYASFRSSGRFEDDLTVDQFSYDDFTGADEIEVYGDASVVGGELELTPGANAQVGAVWHRAKPRVADGFSTEFTFRITELIPYTGDASADGFAFVLHNNAAGLQAQGTLGAGVGYGGLANSVAIEFDTYQNGYDPDGNHISVQTMGEAANRADDTASVALAPEAGLPVFDDGQEHRVRVTYDGDTGQLRVYIDDLFTPALETTLDLDDQLALAGGQAYVGFTSSTGNGGARHVITEWSFDASP